jgi:hypothetical protein
MILPAVILILVGFFMFRGRQRATATMQAPQHNAAKSAPAATALREAPKVSSVKTAQALMGSKVWMQDGYLYGYFPYRHGRVDYAHQAGLVPPMQEMKIQKIVTQRKPRGVKTHVPGGGEQVLAVFTLPGSQKAGQESYAVPIGYTEGKKSEFDCSQMFYYNNPHLIYAYWPQQVWTEIEEHKAAKGMTLLQAQAALGVNETVKTGKHGEETVTYDTGTSHWTVTYQNAKAVAVKQG